MPKIKQTLKNIQRSIFEMVGIDSLSKPSLNDLDTKLAPYLSIKNGVFVELGANDGFNMSNTYYLEKIRGWHGVLVEPIPEQYEKAKKRRPKSKVFNAACVDFDYTDPQVTMTYCDLMSLVQGAFKDPAREAEHIRKGNEIQGINSYTLSVPARTLTSILDESKVTHIDFLSLDVEGFEANVLKGLDFSRFAPDWILIEIRDKAEIDALLLPRYECVTQLTALDYLYHKR